MSTSNIKCPTHNEYYLTNICTLQQCTEPLCPECIPQHIRQHTSTGQVPQIENIQTIKQEQKALIQEIVQKLNEQLFLINNTNQSLTLKNLKTQLEEAKQELINSINNKFNEYILLIESYLKETKVNKNTDNKEANDLVKQQLNKMNQLLNKFETNDYIRAILQTYNDGIGPHIYQSIEKKCQDFEIQQPNIIINQQGLNQIIYDLDYYIQIQRSKSNFTTINNKDLDIVKSLIGTQQIESTITNKVYKSSYQNNQQQSRSKEYHSSQEQFKPSQMPQFVHNTSELMKAIIDGPISPIIIQNKELIEQTDILVSCYGDQRKILIYNLPKFNQPTKNIKEFQELFINSDKRFPVGHQCLFYDKEILLLGGIERDVDRSVSIATVYKINLITKQLMLHSNMIHRRQGFGACVLSNQIYVCCGSSSDSEDNSINTLERFDGSKWTPLRSCMHACTGCTLCCINDEFLIRIGGIDKTFLPVSTIEVYSIRQNIWFDLQITDSKGNIWGDIPQYSGCIQINQNELLIFGGKNDNVLSEHSYIISLEINGQNIRSSIVRRAQSIPTNGVIDQVVVHENQVYAMLTDGEYLLSAQKKIISCNSDKWIYIQNNQ